MTQLTLTELVNALQAVEQRKTFREEEKAAKKALVVTQKGSFSREKKQRKKRSIRTWRQVQKKYISSFS